MSIYLFVSCQPYPQTLLVDLSLVTDVITGQSSQQATLSSSPPPRTKAQRSSQDLSFSLTSGPDTSLADFVASDPMQYSEWTDGFNMLFDKNIRSNDTAEYIHVLTEIGVKVKLLDLSGERVEIPQSVDVPSELPLVAGGFFYDDLFA